MKDASKQYIIDILGLNDEQTELLIQHVEMLEKQTGNRNGVDEWVEKMNDSWEQALRELGVSSDSGAAIIQEKLQERMALVNTAMLDFFENPDLSTEAGWQSVLEKVFESIDQKKLDGYFLKHDVARDLLRKNPPTELIEHFGYSDIEELLEKEDIREIYSSFRFAVSHEWNNTLLELYKTLTPNDFEKRQTEFILMPSDKWFVLAEKFAKAKLHPFSHLKEMGVIFIVPNPHAKEKTAVFKILMTLLMHYLYEVHFYATFFRRIQQEKPEEFGALLAQTIVGGIVLKEIPKDAVRVTHQYYTKKPNPDPRAFEPHVMPEPIHWHNGRRLLRSLMCSAEDKKDCMLNFWDACYTVGKKVDGTLVSLNYADTIVSTKKEHYTYHLFEDVWNAIWIVFSSEEKLEKALFEQFETGMIKITAL